MFDLGLKTAHPEVYVTGEVRRDRKNRSPTPQMSLSLDSLQPAIDGPPSSERIRAYTEQMKRSLIFGHNSRTNTLSSATSSFLSRDSDTASLSRKSSSRSNASSMPSLRSDRPESAPKFSKSIFSRAGRKARRESNALANSTSSFSGTEHSSDGVSSARNDYSAKNEASRRRHMISGPYNFQHVTHTRPDHVSRLTRASGIGMASEFSALRASEAPTNGELKGIRAQDLHFENFSSEAVNASNVEDRTSPAKPAKETGVVVRESASPTQPQRFVNYARSVDNMRSPPPRPPRSPLSPTCPVALPARTSSRTASILFDTFDPLLTTTIARPPPSNGGFRKPAPFSAPPRPPPPPSWSEQEEGQFSQRSMSHAVTTPGDEAWPLSAPGGNFGELADVQEEEEDRPISRRSKVSNRSGELRASFSVPALRMLSYDQAERPDLRLSMSHAKNISISTVDEKSEAIPPAQISEDWEKDVDYCYENELEADDGYHWDRCSAEESSATETQSPSTFAEQPALTSHPEDDDRSIYHGRFRPSLLVPSAYDVPELSPLSNASTSSDPCTPSLFLHPGHARSPSHTSSFKESHGFNLSPSLLIPIDFASQMDHEAIYDEHFSQNSSSAALYSHEKYSQFVPSVDETASSTASYRSSNFSRGSARSSSSTRLSGVHFRASQDSVMMLSRAASINRAHKSIGSTSSLPDLVPSAARRSEKLHDLDLAFLKIAEGDEVVQADPSAHQHRPVKSVDSDQLPLKGTNYLAPAQTPVALETEVGGGDLSPVAESFVEGPRAVGIVHERKSSAPVVSHTVKEYKGRARAATSAGSGNNGGKKKAGAGYMLFPQI